MSSSSPTTAPALSQSIREGTQLNRVELLEALRYEIDRLESEDVKPGWSNWAILGSLAAVIWLFLSECEKGTINFHVVARTMILLWFLRYFFRDALLVLQPRAQPRNFGLRFHPTTGMASQRTYLCVGLLIDLCLLFLVFQQNFSVGTKYLLIALLSLEIFGGTVALITTYVNLLLSAYRAASTSRGPIFVHFVLLGFAIFLAIDQTSFPLTTELKLGLLGAGALYLVMLLLENSTSSPLLQTLKEIHRDFSFGLIDIGTALKQTDIALLGSRIDDVLQDRLVPVLQALEESQRHVLKVRQRYQDASKLFSEQPPRDAESLRIIQAVVESANAHRQSATKSIKELKARVARLKSRSQWIIGADPAAKPEVQSIYQKVTSSSAQVLAELSEVEKELNSFADKLSYHQPATANPKALVSHL